MRAGARFHFALTLVVLSAFAEAAGARPIAVRSTAIGADGRIAGRNTGFGADLSPEVSWTAVPGARAFALILEDPDAPGGRPFVHWLVWNIPAAVTRLAEGAAPVGARQGRNDFGRVGYGGPRPPSGTHHYHLRVVALDAPLALAPGADYTAFAAALRGHVIASGEVVGLASAP
jgi:Raf kinase inhibitor-like YbhB/YbcL family protein